VRQKSVSDRQIHYKNLMKYATVNKRFRYCIFTGSSFADLLPIGRQVIIDKRRSGIFLQMLIMRLKKFFKSCSLRNGGQAIVEYFILLVLIAALTIIGGSVLFGKVKTTTNNFRDAAYEKMAPYPGP